MLKKETLISVVFTVCFRPSVNKTGLGGETMLVPSFILSSPLLELGTRYCPYKVLHDNCWLANTRQHTIQKGQWRYRTHLR